MINTKRRISTKPIIFMLVIIALTKPLLLGINPTQIFREKNLYLSSDFSVAAASSTSTPDFSVWFPLVTMQYQIRKILFVSNRSEGFRDNIFIISSSGSGLRNLTNDLQRDDSLPVWSPTGDKIAFSSYASNDYGIFVMNPDGTEKIRLTTDLDNGISLAWSPDGTKIAFDAFVSGDPEIYVMNADGTGLNNLSNHPANDTTPSWSPDSTQIVFRSERDGSNGEIYIVNVDGTDLFNLTNNDSFDFISERVSAWSPDGTKIIFSSFSDDNTEIYVINVDGTQLTNLTQRQGDDFDPTWSPDGSKIAFAFLSADREFSGIEVMNSDGTGKIKLVTTEYFSYYHPIWSPDGNQLAFTVYSGGTEDVFVVNADGTGLINLSNNEYDDYFPAWQP